MMKKIIIIDDNRALLTILTNSFRRDGYIVDSATDGEEGLKKMIKGNYSAAILDYEMPKLNGLDLFNKVCEEGLPVKDRIIFYTGKTCKDLLRNLEKHKVPYLIKPGELSKLKEQIAFYCKDAAD